MYVRNGGKLGLKRTRTATLKWVPSRTARPTRCPAIISQLKWLRRCTKNGSYASVGSLGVLSESSFYTVGTCVKDDNGDADLMIFVSTQDPNSAGVVRHSTQTLVLILLVTLVVMLVISFMISQHVTRPLKTIAAAAKEFAGGNFDVRVPEDNRCYECRVWL